MVYYSSNVHNDLEQIRIGLLKWSKITLTEEFVAGYVESIKNVCDSLDAKSYHANTIYAIHKQYGTKVHTYKRNQRTVWYIIYDVDMYKNIYVHKIISNYQTH
ncbi:hypothetical protein AGMMS4956_04650 [Bacteroidia bacterium]|nr:hypothetical protein AGMMS4956_04650 [Bacteroidia bacterium]